MVQGSNPGVGARFSSPVQNGPGAYPASSTLSTGSLPGVKRLCVALTVHQHSVDAKERLQLCFHSPSGLSWQVRGWNLPVTL